MLDALELKLGDETYQVRPTFGVIMAIERRLGKSVLAVLASADKPEGIRLTDIAVVLHEAARAAGCKLKLEEVGELVMVSGGFADYMVVAAQYLSAAVTAGPEQAVGELPDGATKSH